jgi:hypothetical protein
MMMQRRADVRGRQTANGDADKGVDVESCSENARFSGQIGGSSNQPKTTMGAR